MDYVPANFRFTVKIITELLFPTVHGTLQARRTHVLPSTSSLVELPNVVFHASPGSLCCQRIHDEGQRRIKRHHAQTF